MFLLTKKSKIDMLKRAESKGFPLNNKLRAQIRDKTVKVSEWKDEISDAKRWLSFKITTKDDKLRKKLTTLKRGAVLFGFPIDTKTFLSMQTRPSEVDYFLGAWRDYKKEGLPKVKKHCDNNPTCVRRWLWIDNSSPLMYRRFK